jgi:hypothetical protein
MFLIALGILCLPLGASISVVAIIRMIQPGQSSAMWGQESYSCVTSTLAPNGSRLLDWIVAPVDPFFNTPYCNAHFSLSMLWVNTPFHPFIHFFIGPGVMFLGTVLLGFGVFGAFGRINPFGYRRELR